jgi:hypothetical protein
MSWNFTVFAQDKIQGIESEASDTVNLVLPEAIKQLDFYMQSSK